VLTTQCIESAYYTIYRRHRHLTIPCEKNFKIDEDAAATTVLKRCYGIATALLQHCYSIATRTKQIHFWKRGKSIKKKDYECRKIVIKTKRNWFRALAQAVRFSWVKQNSKINYSYFLYPNFLSNKKKPSLTANWSLRLKKKGNGAYKTNRNTRIQNPSGIGKIRRGNRISKERN